MATDNIRFVILEDGTVKLEVDGVSGTNHASADALVSLIAKTLGGETTITKQKHAHTHAHGHTHVHN